MRTQSMMLMACLVLVLAVAAPSLANNPLPNERAFYAVDDDTVFHPVPLPVVKSLPFFQPYLPWIPIPLLPEPGIDDGPFQRLVKPVTSTSPKHAR
ncbi:hypothetical protein KQI52_04890 [bacterium]|nr:hypothetical protein [bacterium]